MFFPSCRDRIVTGNCEYDNLERMFGVVEHHVYKLVDFEFKDITHKEVKNGWLIFAHALGLLVLSIITLIALVVFAIARFCLKEKIKTFLEERLTIKEPSNSKNEEVCELASNDQVSVVENVLEESFDVLENPINKDIVEVENTFSFDKWDGLKTLSKENLEVAKKLIMEKTPKENLSLIEKLKNSFYIKTVENTNSFTACGSDFKVITKKGRGITVKKLGQLVVFEDRGGVRQLAIISSYSHSKFGQIINAEITFYRDLEESTPMVRMCKKLDQLYDPTQDVKTAFEKAKRCEYTDRVAKIIECFRKKKRIENVFYE